MRAATYRRLRRHWYFHNALKLFEVSDHVKYGIHVYGGARKPEFLQATSLYHPSTVEASFKHDGSGVEPGLKDDEGRWDLRAHSSRIQHVDESTLGTWHAVLEDAAVPIEQTRMVYTVNRATAAVLDKLAASPRIGSLGLKFSAGWHEKNDRTKGYFDSEWGVPESWDSVILQGPHLHVGNPFYKSPNPTMLHNQDWTAVDLEALHPNAIPATQYKPRGDRAIYAGGYTHWEDKAGASVASRDRYRIAWRKMAANTGERTLITALIPPGTAHIDGLVTVGSGDRRDRLTVAVAAHLSSLLSDSLVRSAPMANIRISTIERLPYLESELTAPLLLRTLRLNCMSDAYGELWSATYDSMFSADSWAGGTDRADRPMLGDVAANWSSTVPLRRAVDRRQAQLEIDVLIALGLGISAAELTTIYRTQFPVLYGYDHDEYLYDAHGRLVPTEIRQIWKRAGEPMESAHLNQDLRTVYHAGSGVAYTYQLPFIHLDRETDLRAAYNEFARHYARSA
ncbi:hypothetical protein [Microbacterium sp. A84]|uniref:hypothetical protein n=1 Tax=Microbacterium sp. A84 TaxID=3450715 RepID=UPI003F4346D1